MSSKKARRFFFAACAAWVTLPSKVTSSCSMHDAVLGDAERFPRASSWGGTGVRNLDEVEFRLMHLDRFFAGWRLRAIDQAAVRQYVLRRQARRASNGTINRELAVLVRMLRLAYGAGS